MEERRIICKYTKLANKEHKLALFGENPIPPERMSLDWQDLATGYFWLFPVYHTAPRSCLPSRPRPEAQVRLASGDCTTRIALLFGFYLSLARDWGGGERGLGLLNFANKNTGSRHLPFPACQPLVITVLLSVSSTIFG